MSRGICKDYLRVRLWAVTGFIHQWFDSCNTDFRQQSRGRDNQLSKWEVFQSFLSSWFVQIGNGEVSHGSFRSQVGGSSETLTTAKDEDATAARILGDEEEKRVKLLIISYRAQRLTVTRKKVAGIEVPPSSLVFCAFASTKSCLWSSSTFPLFSAASYAFIVGP